MNSRQVFRRLLLPATAVVGAANVSTSEGHNLTPYCTKCTECNCKPSQLPLYPVECNACKTRPAERPASDIESAIGKVRSELWVWQDEVNGYRQRVVDFIDTGIAHSSSSIDFLREESNAPERAGAVGLGALTGLIFGLRGGIFKRLTYTTVGGLSMAAVCYPKAAAEYSELALQEGNRYFVAGYHFLFGETPKVPDWLETVIGDTKEKIQEVTGKNK